MKTREREKDSRDSLLLLLLILLVGFICIILISGWALRFAPNWRLDSNMGSRLDPNSDFLTHRPNGFIEPIDPSILTDPGWLGVFLTPGATFPTRSPNPTSTNTPPPTNTNIPTVVIISSPTNIAVPTNTLVYFPPPPLPSATSKPPRPKRTATPTATSTATPVPIPSVNLQISNTDNSTDYVASATKTYVIVVSNTGPNGVTGATFTDSFTPIGNITGITWTCIPSGGAFCSNGAGVAITDTVNLPAGSSITYTVAANTSSGASGSLTNTATVTAPPGYTGTTTATAADTDQQIVINPPGNIGPSPDSSSTNIPSGSYLTLQFGTPLVVGGHPSYDLVYYPDPAAPTLQMDLVILQISDGSNWYTIFNWGDGSADGNTDISYGICSTEPDNCVITIPPTHPPGVSIQVDGVVPPGTYSYIRIISPPDSGDGVDVDAIQVLP